MKSGSFSLFLQEGRKERHLGANLWLNHTGFLASTEYLRYTCGVLCPSDPPGVRAWTVQVVLVLVLEQDRTGACLPDVSRGLPCPCMGLLGV